MFELAGGAAKGWEAVLRAGLSGRGVIQFARAGAATGVATVLEGAVFGVLLNRLIRGKEAATSVSI